MWSSKSLTKWVKKCLRVEFSVDSSLVPPHRKCPPFLTITPTSFRFRIRPPALRIGEADIWRSVGTRKTTASGRPATSWTLRICWHCRKTIVSLPPNVISRVQHRIKCKNQWFVYLFTRLFHFPIYETIPICNLRETYCIPLFLYFFDHKKKRNNSFDKYFVCQTELLFWGCMRVNFVNFWSKLHFKGQ